MATMILVLQAIGLVKEIDALQETRMAKVTTRRQGKVISEQFQRVCAAHGGHHPFANGVCRICGWRPKWR